MVVNNIIANRDRLFNKFNKAATPNCLACGVVQDNVHLFCECKLVREAWFWVRQRLLGMLPDSHGQTSNFEFLNLMFESDLMDSEIVWMLGIFVQLVWNFVICKKNTAKRNTHSRVAMYLKYNKNAYIFQSPPTPCFSWLRFWLRPS